MFALEISNNDLKRAIRILDFESEPSIEFEKTNLDDGFGHLIQFPGMGEVEFRDLSIKLQQNGVRLIGADTQLTERKIMKLAKLLESPLEQFNDEEITEKDVMNRLKEALKDEDGSRGADPTSKFWGVIADIVGDYEDYKIDMIREQKEIKLRKLIRKTIRK
jgi:hypothetical protein|tara:strand:+ start:103 stop:588 length:486 start_codon:yes stop_codon:yes gene_type:complete